MKTNIIAVDFDGTLCINEFPEIGEPITDTIEYIKKKKKNGDKIILWTSRNEEQTKKAVEWCSEQGLTFDAVNENLPEIIEAFGGDCRKIFANEYIDDRNKLVYECRKKSNMEKWAENEVAIACHLENPDRKEGEWDYGCACYESALKAFRSLCNDGHSGFSIGLTKAILNRLIDGKTLTPIEDIPQNWGRCDRRKDGTKTYQCKRMSSLFKKISKDGEVSYSDVNRCYGVNIDSPNSSYHSRLIDNIIAEMYPITMPYIPYDKPFKVYTEDFLTDPKNGDFDTVGIFYVITPAGKRVEINRYFKDAENGYDEINKAEYLIRKEQAYAKGVKEEDGDTND